MKNLILHSCALLMLFFASITVFSATNPVIESDSELRSGTTEKENILFIDATKDNTTTGTVILKYAGSANKLDGEDIYKLFTPILEVADIYSLTEGYALAFNKFNTYPFTAPLGIKTESLGKVILKFRGANSFKDADVYLINSMDGSEQNLKENDVYELTLNGSNNQGTLFVSFRNAGIYTYNQIVANDESIKISTEGDKIKINSSPKDLIREVILFSLSGNIIDQYCCFLNTSNYEISVSENQIYLVQVFTDKKTRVVKIFVK